MKTLVILAMLSAPVLAETCPPSQDNRVELSALITQLRDAKNESAARPLSDQMWEIWLRAPDALAQEILDKGLRQRNNFDFAEAMTSFDLLVAYCPDYAEGYNQRGFTHFMRQDFKAALIDLDVALRLSPDHIGVQSGRSLTLMNLGRLSAARTQMLQALENNPWLSERALVAKGAVLGPKGEDI